jgi:tRNA(Ser,Leu) C12 N-acetylase TAN1
MWVTTILKELIKESVTIRRILRRRGIGLILVTQHHADVLNRIIQDNQQFLAQYFPNTWRYIASEEFDDRIVKTIEDIGQYFEELAGRWFHVDRLEEYFHEIGRRERYFAPIEGSNGIIRLRFDQIVSIEVSPDKSTITYLPNLHVKQLASLETRDLQLTNEENQDIAFMTFMEIGAIDISAYRRGQLPEGFYPVNEYFLQARRRNPLTFINNSLTWHVAAHPNRGRILQFLEKKIHCNFTCLNSYFKL